MRLESSSEQPKILRRMVIRFSILALVLAGIIFGFMKFREVSQDIDLPANNETEGFIAAIQIKETGTQVVVIKPDGSILESPGWRDEVNDGEPSWRPDGNRLFFVSNREDNAQNVFRWNIDGNAINRRTVDSRSKSAPIWPAANGDEPSRSGLVVTGKLVLEFNATEGSMRQILPPIQRELTSSDPERGGPEVGSIYRKLQDNASFKTAMLSPDRRFIYAIMRQESDELLIVQDLFEDKAPIPIAMAQQLEIDVHPTSGAVVYCALDFRLVDPASAPAEFIQDDGSIKLPFRHVLAYYDPTKPPEEAQKLIITSLENDSAFRWPKCSPDGELIALQAGQFGGPGRFDSKGILRVPIKEAAGNEVRKIYEGPAMEHAWTPESRGLVFVQTVSATDRAIFRMNLDGTGLQNLTEGKGRFAFPSVSPKTK